MSKCSLLYVYFQLCSKKFNDYISQDRCALILLGQAKQLWCKSTKQNPFRCAVSQQRWPFMFETNFKEVLLFSEAFFRRDDSHCCFIANANPFWDILRVTVAGQNGRDVKHWSKLGETRHNASTKYSFRGKLVIILVKAEVWLLFKYFCVSRIVYLQVKTTEHVTQPINYFPKSRTDNLLNRMYFLTDY